MTIESIARAESTRSVATGAPWWKRAVVYQVYPRSFADSNGDGIGDLGGVRAHLDYLAWLGVDAVWLSPFYPSPMVDAGYDVADYCDVDRRLGSLAEFDQLVHDAHDVGIRVLIDWVPNHTSDQHPWFLQARRSRHDAKRDWYIWRDEPNNWRAAFGAGSAWSFDETTSQYYLHFFLPEQPDLNWANPEVERAMHDVLRFWLDRGVDGFRIDVAHCLGKDPTFADDPRCDEGQALSSINDQPVTHEHLRRIRRVVDDFPGDRLIVGEVNLRDTAAVARYYGDGDELHLAFNFLPLDAPWDAAAFKAVIAEVERELPAHKAWPTWVLSNHDNARHRTRYGGSEDRARAAAVLLLTLRGTTFLYQGEEIGLADADIPRGEHVDPGGRDGCRAPIPWEAQPPHGWQGERPWLPFATDASTVNAHTAVNDPDSIVHLYRRLLQVRRGSDALTVGTLELRQSPPGTLAYERIGSDGNWTVVVNFTASTVEVRLAEGHEMVIRSTDPCASGDTFDGRVGPDEAVLLRPPSPKQGDR